MGLTLVGLTLVSGAVAAVVAIRAVARRGGIVGSREIRSEPPGRDEIAVSLISQILVAGESDAATAEAAARQRLGSDAKATVEIEISSWSRRYAAFSSRSECESLLAAAIDLASRDRRHIGVAQYGALVDLCFGLGLQTDVFSRLLASHRSAWTDYASDRRARGGGAREKSRAALLATLGLRDDATRRQLISAYRRSAARYHPDRHHNLPDDERSAAAARFIEITEAYETLLQQLRD